MSDMHEPAVLTSHVSRRQVLVGGAASAGLLLATRLAVGANAAQAATACAALTPAGEIGPYFVEEKLSRSDVRTDPSTGVAIAGVPLTLDWALLDEDDACAALAGAQVDIWHADPSGVYSDEASEGTSGKKYLRGYQVSDGSGKVTFKTVFPGWYPGRTPHIHARFRIFDATGTATYDFLSQVMFDESDIATIYGVAPYSSRAAKRDTTNAADHVYQAEASEGTPAILAMTGNPADGYVGTFTFGLLPSGGVASGAGSAGTGPGSKGTGAGSGAGTTSTSSVLASLSSAKITRSRLGNRTLRVTIATRETTALTIKLKRGSKTLKTRRASALPAGTRTLKMAIPSSLSTGRVTIDMTFKDSAGNSKHLARIRHVPAAG
jgi:protocatechuate 3,4-dioxygenase beta subunit